MRQHCTRMQFKRLLASGSLPNRLAQIKRVIGAVMEFWVKLIDVSDTSGGEARDNLQANCTHVGGSLWLYEGDAEALHQGIIYSLVGEEAIESYGDMSGSALKRFVRETYNVDKCFLS